MATPTPEREAARLTVLALRRARRFSQQQFAAAAGLNRRAISLYELGQKTPRRPTLERLAVAAGVSEAQLEQLLGTFRQLFREVSAPVAEASAAPALRPATVLEDFEASRPRRVEEVLSAIAETLRPIVDQALTVFDAELLSPGGRLPLPPDQARAEAAELWARIEGYCDREHRLILDFGAEYQTWAFVERLCEESFQAVRRGEADRALELAELALYAAERTPEPEAARARRLGYAWAFVARAHQGKGDPASASEAAERALELWSVSEPSPFEALDHERAAEALAGLDEPPAN